jgi:hypothetical protein
MINIKCSSYTLYQELKYSVPEGVSLELQPIKMGFKDAAPSPDALTAALNINITIDLTKVAIAVVSAWVAKQYINVRSRETEIKVLINSKEISADKSESQKLIEAELVKESENT